MSVRRVLISLMLCAAFGCGPQAELVEQAEVVRPARIHQVSSASAINRRTFVARVEAPQTVDLSFEVSGPLVDLPVKEGEVVAKGSVIAVLDPSDFQRAVLEAEVQLDLARSDLARKRQLLKQNLMSVSLVDEAEVFYQMSEYYRADSGAGVRWDDPAFGIEWPLPEPILSTRDASYANVQP